MRKINLFLVSLVACLFMTGPAFGQSEERLKEPLLMSDAESGERGSKSGTIVIAYWTPEKVQDGTFAYTLFEDWVIEYFRTDYASPFNKSACYLSNGHFVIAFGIGTSNAEEVAWEIMFFLMYKFSDYGGIIGEYDFIPD